MNNEFKVHMLTEEGKKKTHKIALIFDECLEALKGVCIEGRYLALVKTKLEEAGFFAKKSMAEKNCIDEKITQA